MATAAPRGGSADGDRRTTEHSNSIPSAAAAQVAAPDFPAFRERLVAARARLVERIILEYDPEHAYPSTAWTRMVSDIQATILAVDDMMGEGEP